MAAANVTFCPLFQYYDTEGLRKEYDSQKERWWYGCIGPRAPYPTYHVDDTWLSARLIGWMQAEYNVVGNLFWATDVFAAYNTSNGYQSIEEYYESTGSRFPNVNGDGFLFYPGKKYGVDGPLGSMRLEAIRDGYEEYEILYAIKQSYEAKNASLGGYQLDFEGFVNSLTSSMYSGMVVSTSTAEFASARESLFEVAQLHQQTGFSVIEYKDDGYGKKTYKFIVDKAWTVKEGDTQLTAVETQGNNAIYSIEKTMTDEGNKFSLIFSNGQDAFEYIVDMGGKVSVVHGSELNTADFEEKTVMPNTTVSGKNLKISLAKISDPDVAEQSFVMKGSNLSHIGAETNKIVLHIYYEGDDNPVLTLNGKFANSRVNSEIKSVALKKGDNEISIGFSVEYFETAGMLEKIIFAFYREENALEIPAHEITIKDIVFYNV